MIKKCSMRYCRYFSRLGVNFANLPLLDSCTLIALKHLMVVSSMWPIGPLVQALNQSFVDGEMSISQRQAVITLTEKKR